MTEIRPATDADAGEIVRVRRASWVAAYSGIIPAEIIERATASGGRAVTPPPWRRMLVAVAAPGAAAPEVPAPGAAAPEVPAPEAAAPGAAAEPRPVVGYAGFGPERAILPPSPAPLTQAGLGGEVGELYALYVTPAWWSAGVGRSLIGAALAALRADGYQRAVLWVLAENARARRFYDKAGFRPDGAANEMPGLGGVVEVRYARDL